MRCEKADRGKAFIEIHYVHGRNMPNLVFLRTSLPLVKYVVQQQLTKKKIFIQQQQQVKR